MNEDATLLRRYVEESNQEAFSTLVERHIGLVYTAALRRSGGDGQRAADVAQEVFTALGRQARTLQHHPALGAWLHTATRNIAVNLMRAEQRRAQRHRVAAELATAQAAPRDADWNQVRPVLDAVIDELPEADRRAIVFRFLQKRGFAEIGSALGISEDAARMRTDRALDKLRQGLARRGITSTAAALGASLSTHAVGAAPAALAQVVAAKSLAAAAAGGAGLLTAKLAALILTCATAAFVAGAFVGHSRGSGSTTSTAAVPSLAAARTEENDKALREENRQLRAMLGQVTTEVSRLEAANAQLAGERAATPTPAARAGRVLGEPLPRHEVQRKLLNNLRQMAAAIDQYHFEHKRWPVTIHDIVGGTAYVRRIVPVEGEDYASLALDGKALTVTTASGITVTYDSHGNTSSHVETPPALARAEQLREKLESVITTAREAYRVAHHGKDPSDERALIPFFATPQQGADYVEFLEALQEIPR